MKIYLIGSPVLQIEDILVYVEKVLMEDEYHHDIRFDKFALTQEFAQDRLNTCKLLKPSLQMKILEFNLDKELVSRLVNETYRVVESSLSVKIKPSDSKVSMTREGGALRFQSISQKET